MASVFDRLPQAVLSIGPDGRVRDANPAAERLLGRSARALIGADAAWMVGIQLRSSGRLRGCITRRDGTPVPVDLSLEPAGDEGSRVLILLELDRDRLAAESRSVLDLAFDNTPICAAVFNTDGEYVRVNDNLCRMLGRSPAQLLGHRDQEFTHPDDRQGDVDAAMRILRGELDTWRTEKRFLRPDGGVVWAIANMTFLRDAGGGPLCWVGQFQEITERRLMEDRLRERERQLEEAQRIAEIGSWELDFRDGSVVWSNELCHLYGLPPGEMPSTLDSFLALVHPDDRELVVSRFTHAVQRRAELDCEHRMICPDGTLRDIRAIGRFDLDEAGDPLRMVGTVQDVTQRRQAELELRAAREHSEAIVSAMGEGYMLGDGKRILAVNDALCAMTGFTREELLGAEPPYPFWPSELHERDLRERGSILSDSDVSGGADLERTLLHRDGHRFEAELTIRPACGPDGATLGFVTTVRDVSERKRREAELERERRDLNAAQAVARIGSWDYDQTADHPGRWSLQLWRMLGLEPRPQAPSFPDFLSLVHPEDQDRVREAIEDARALGRSWDGEFRMVGARGRELHVAFRTELARAADGTVTGAFGTIQDVTDRAQRDAEQAALRRVAELVAENAPADAVFATVADQVRRLFGAHGGMVARFEAAEGLGVLVSGCTSDGEVEPGVTFPLDGQTASAAVYRTGRAAKYDVLPAAPEAGALDCMRRREATGGLAAPIYVAGELWGSVAAAFSTLAVPADAERRLSRFADLVAMAIANAEAWETLARQAATDPITGLANHRTFYERLRSEVQRARRYHRELSVVVLDLDHFKAVNDAFGHQAGDRVLVEFAQRLAREAREGEVVARIGGEEFAWLMPETGQEGAYQAAERVRRATESEPLGEVGTVTVSAGVCSGGPELDGEDLVRYADRALYWAKDGGRNTTFLYTPEAHELLSRRSGSVERLQVMSSVRALARAIDSKDSSTGRHSERVAEFAEQLALQLGWTAKRARLLHACGLLHDVGKIGIPDDILLRLGRLSPADYDEVKRHAELSAEIAAEVLEAEQVAWIRGHHERWDGTGYPDGLAGDAIPDGAQLLALADAWDVMTESRTYKPTKPFADAVLDVRSQAGRQFAPAAVDALLAVVGAAAAQ